MCGYSIDFPLLIYQQWCIERKAIAQDAMSNITRIDNNSREEVENKKQETIHQCPIVMQENGKVPHQFAI